MRIVSLTCSNTEIVCALGCGEQLVGVDDHSDFPALVRALPRVGPDLQIDVGAVAALRPDLVLASRTVPGHDRVVDAIDAAGLRWIAPDPESLGDVYRDVHTIAGLLEVEARGEALIEQMRAAIQPHAPILRPSVLIEWWPKPVIVPGRRSWVTDLLWAAGGRNPAGEREVLSTPVTDDEVQQMAPDAIVICWCGVPPERYRPDVVRRRSGWRQLPALRHDQIHCVPEAYLGRPGPRLVEGYRALRGIVQGLGARGQGAGT
ncbi:MAG TPA: cobalamin-binding protein [Deltaproteobacteria bacterium]|nr:cobalamin-binding protein [Deltaproteobacteria bacterium]